MNNEGTDTDDFWKDVRFYLITFGVILLALIGMFEGVKYVIHEVLTNAFREVTTNYNR